MVICRLRTVSLVQNWARPWNTQTFLPSTIHSFCKVTREPLLTEDKVQQKDTYSDTLAPTLTVKLQ